MQNVRTLKYPPWYNVSGGPNIATSHSNKLSSFNNLTRKPSTGSSCRLLYSRARALTAELLGVVVVDIFVRCCVSNCGLGVALDLSLLTVGLAVTLFTHSQEYFLNVVVFLFIFTDWLQRSNDCPIFHLNGDRWGRMAEEAITTTKLLGILIKIKFQIIRTSNRCGSVAVSLPNDRICISKSPSIRCAECAVGKIVWLIDDLIWINNKFDVVFVRRRERRWWVAFCLWYRFWLFPRCIMGVRVHTRAKRTHQQTNEHGFECEHGKYEKK